MSDLRLTINKLKTYDEIPHLKDSLKELLNKFDSFNILKINLLLEGDIDDMPLKYKNFIYYSIKEGIVNSLKHSNSKEVTVNVQNLEHDINLSISDNGVGCKKLVYSNGLRKISDMVENLEGQIEFSTNVGKGFKINIHLEKEDFYD
jgi:signal transduction histidine kinase